MRCDLRRPFQTAPDHPGPPQICGFHSIHYVTLLYEWLFYVKIVFDISVEECGARPIARL